MPRLPRLPDLLTTANLCCGVASILLASEGQLTIACGLVFLAALFDVLDGLAARVSRQGGTELGKQLDSLADMVSFGVAPALVTYMRASALSGEIQGLVTAASLIMAVASCWRLARFNVDSRQAGGFLGLPTPANGLFWVSMVLGSLGVAVAGGPGHHLLAARVMSLLGSPSAFFAASLGLAILMLSSVPLPSLKFRHFRWKGNEVIYCLLLAACCLLLLYGVLAVPLILIIYLLSPLWGRLFPKTLEPPRRNDATP